MTALDGFPCRMLAFPMRALFGRMPANCRGIEENLGTLHGCQARRFRIPLVPTNEHTDFCVTGGPGAKSKIAGSEIELFIVQWIIRNVHFSVLAQKRSIGINDDRGVVVKSRCPLFK